MAVEREKLTLQSIIDAALVHAGPEHPVILLDQTDEPPPTHNPPVPFKLIDLAAYRALGVFDITTLIGEVGSESACGTVVYDARHLLLPQFDEFLTTRAWIVWRWGKGQGPANSLFLLEPDSAARGAANVAWHVNTFSKVSGNAAEEARHLIARAHVLHVFGDLVHTRIYRISRRLLNILANIIRRLWRR